jgi:hypothetical protein
MRDDVAFHNGIDAPGSDGGAMSNDTVECERVAAEAGTPRVLQ